MVGVDLFAGAGGLSLGAVHAGIEVRLAVESDRNAAATYGHNHGQTTVIVNDVRNVAELPAADRGRARVLFGGPPCQGFSTSNQRTRTLGNPDNWLFEEFMRLTRDWRPEWVILENVRGLTCTEGGFFLEAILESFQRAGYTTSWWVLNAADYGVPQLRHRLFVVGSLHGLRPNRPVPTPRPSEYVTVQDAIDDLPELPNGANVGNLRYRKQARSNYTLRMRGDLEQCGNHLVTRNADIVLRRYKYVPQGGNWQDIPARLMRSYANRNRCHTGIYHRLKADAPSLVIGNYRKNMLIHPTQDRGLSVREAARLQSFPDWYEFVGSIGFQQQQVGNAVPPLLAQAVFATVMTAQRCGN